MKRCASRHRDGRDRSPEHVWGTAMTEREASY
jgi:hypothetical protein